MGETEDGRTTYGRRITFQDVEWSVANGDPVDKPLGQRWIANPAALAKWGRENGTRHLFGVFEDRDETDTTRLIQKTWNELVSREDPQITYKMSLSVLEKLSGYDHKKVRLGDTVLVVDKEFKPELLVKARVIELKRNLNDPTVADVVLGNFIPTLAENQIRQVKINQNVEDKSGVWDRADSLNEDGTIDLEKVNGAEDLLIVVDKVESIELDVQYLVANSATIEMLDSVVGSFETLLADKASISALDAVIITVDDLAANKADLAELNAVVGRVDHLEANIIDAERISALEADVGELFALEATVANLQASKADVTDLVAINATIESLQTGKADIGDLEAINAIIGTLEVDLGKIETLVAGNITSDNIRAGSLTGEEFHATTTLRVGTEDDVAILTGEHPDYRLFIGNQDPSIAPFSVTQEGTFTATDANIEGTINAISGEFSGAIKIGDTAGIDGSIYEDPNHVRIWAGLDGEFEVYGSGLVKATELELKQSLIADNATLSGILRVGEDGILLDGDTGRLSSATYASGLSGWVIDRNGNSEFNNAKIRGQIESAIFVQNEIHAQGGTMLVRPAGTLRDEIDRVDKGRNLIGHFNIIKGGWVTSDGSIQINSSGRVATDFIAIPINTKDITFSYDGQDYPASGVKVAVGLYDAEFGFIERLTSADTSTPKTFTLPENVAYIRLSYPTELRAYDDYAKLEKGSTATPWTPAPEDNMPFDITVENPASGHYPMFEQDDILRIKNSQYDTWVTVNGVAQSEDACTYSCTVLEGDLVFKFPEGTNIVSYGQTGSGGLIFTSEGDYSPYLDIFESVAEPWNGLNTKARLGNLKGITDPDFGSIEGYGLYSDNAYLKGSILLPDAGITNVSDESIVGSPVRHWAGAPFSDRHNAPYRVLQDGTLYASKAIIEGEIRGAFGTFTGSVDVGDILLGDDGILRIKDEFGNAVVKGSRDGFEVYGEGFRLYEKQDDNSPYFSVALNDKNIPRIRTQEVVSWEVTRDDLGTDSHIVGALSGNKILLKQFDQNIISEFDFEEKTVYEALISSPDLLIETVNNMAKIHTKELNVTSESGLTVNTTPRPGVDIQADRFIGSNQGLQFGGKAQAVYNETDNSVSFVFFD